MEEYNKMRKKSSFSTLPFVDVCYAFPGTRTRSLENVSLVDQYSSSLDDYDEDDNNNDINNADRNNNCNAQGKLDDLPLMQE
eukprot:654150-Ditylum_brightwellii.AAC.1